MALTTNPSISARIHPILGALRSSVIPAGQQPVMRQVPAVSAFVTISRQAGAGAWTLAQKLVDRLNASESSPGERPWTAWDRELVEKVARDLHIHQQIVESLEESSHTWLGDFLAGLSTEAAGSDEVKVFHAMATTIRGLAQAGRVVLVGCSGVFVTRDMPGGLHVRLIAPFEHRVRHMMELKGFTHDAATRYVRVTDRNREAFFKRYWPDEALAPEKFSLILNTAHLSEEQLVQCIVPLIPRPAVTAGPGRSTDVIADAIW